MRGDRRGRVDWPTRLHRATLYLDDALRGTATNLTVEIYAGRAAGTDRNEVVGALQGMGVTADPRDIMMFFRRG